jgi:hypothetical protein
MVGTVKKPTETMDFQEDLPNLRRRLAPADHIFADAGFADVDAEFEEFPVDTTRAPKRIVEAFAANESTHFRTVGRPRRPRRDWQA